jgi:NADH-quinone oxidoreductase subunit E
MPTIRIAPTPQAAEPGQTPHALGLNLKWSAQAQKHISTILSHYPADRSRSATIPLLHLAQREFGGWLSVDAMQLVADTLGLPYIRVYEVASFYTMFNLQPVGKFHLQVCTNCACLIRGSDEVVKEIKTVTGVHGSGDTTPDGTFTFTEVECLGACVAAPMMQVGTHYFTNLTPQKTRQILSHLKQGGDPAKYADTPPAPNADPIHTGKYGA